MDSVVQRPPDNGFFRLGPLLQRDCPPRSGSRISPLGPPDGTLFLSQNGDWVVRSTAPARAKGGGQVLELAGVQRAREYPPTPPGEGVRARTMHRGGGRGTLLVPPVPSPRPPVSVPPTMPGHDKGPRGVYPRALVLVSASHPLTTPGGRSPWPSTRGDARRAASPSPPQRRPPRGGHIPSPRPRGTPGGRCGTSRWPGRPRRRRCDPWHPPTPQH